MADRRRGGVVAHSAAGLVEVRPCSEFRRRLPTFCGISSPTRGRSASRAIWRWRLGIRRSGTTQRRDPFGAAGDFTTAPEISQMFGELVGLWAAEMWHGLGRPDPVHVVELGPGRGHPHGRCLARRPRLARLSRCGRRSSRGNQPGPARRPAANPGRAGRDRDVARRHRRPARGAGHRGRQRILRCPADPTVRAYRPRLVRAARRPGR